MPIVTFHVPGRRYPDDQLRELLVASAGVYAQTLDSPIERVRAFVSEHRPQLCLVAGELVDDGVAAAPYFEFLVLAGRPLQLRQSLLTAFTDLIVEHLGAQRELVRGRAIEVPPEDWGIGGVPASELRRAEILARVEATS